MGLFHKAWSAFGSDKLWNADFSAMDLSTSSNSATLQSAVSATGLTFTRSYTANAATVQTGAMTVVLDIPVNTPRIGNAGYGRGLCFEPPRTNQAQYANQQSTSPWGQVGLTLAADNAVAPDGTTTAERLLEDGTNNVHTTTQNTLSVSGTQPYTVSNWLKINTRQWAGIRFSSSTGNAITVDLSNKAVTAGEGGGLTSGRVEGTANDWIHAIFTATPPAGATSSQTYLNGSSGAYSAYVGSSSIWAWGFQVEAGSYPTELIVTAGATLARSGDRMVRSTAPLIANNRLRFEAKFIPKGSMNSSSTDYGSDGFYIYTQEPEGTTTYAWIDGNRNLTVKVNAGSTATFRVPITMDRGDTVETFIINGNGNPRAWIRVTPFGGSAGPCIPLGEPEVATANMTTANTDFFGNNGTNVSGSWVQTMAAWKDGKKPTWVDVDENAILYADFTTLPLSTSSNGTLLQRSLQRFGFGFSRASVATVQTSASTVVTDIAVDIPRIGNGGFGQGLVNEATRTNYQVHCRNVLAVSGWNSGSGTIQGDFAQGPDGVLKADRYNLASGEAGYYGSGSGVAGKMTASFWSRANTGTQTIDSYFTKGTDTAVQSTTVGTTWTRHTLTADDATAGYAALKPNDGRTLGAPYNFTAGATDTFHDMFQVENGGFPTEFIDTGTTGSTVMRSKDRLYVFDDRSAIHGGRLSMEIKFIAKGSRADMYASETDLQVYAFSAVSASAYISNTGMVTIYHPAGIHYTCTTALNWSRGDTVELWIETGGGSLNTVVKARVNGGSVVTLGTSGVAGSSLTGGGGLIDIFGYAGFAAYSISAWIQKVAFYKNNTRPAWAA